MLVVGQILVSLTLSVLACNTAASVTACKRPWDTILSVASCNTAERAIAWPCLTVQSTVGSFTVEEKFKMLRSWLHVFSYVHLSDVVLSSIKAKKLSIESLTLILISTNNKQLSFTFTFSTLKNVYRFTYKMISDNGVKFWIRCDHS